MLALPAIASRKIYKTASNEDSFIECASLNKSSLQSFASGHEDGTIKIWKIGNDESISSFESNLAITCIEFNDDKINNNLLVSGNIGGGIKLYDLNENKLIRNYSGHRCQVKDINFFDFNNGTTLIISCSADSNVKIWDIRSKTNILTFKGHTNTVNCVDFSPDGNWIVSADCIGHTKLWDISTSKCIHQFHDKQSINDILFHPEELVLATAAGKVVRFWDLETMQHIAKTSKVTTPIKKIIFTQNNHQSIISASNQSLRIWQWDPLPVYCTNNISVHWNNKIVDMKQIKGYNDLICLELDKNKVVVWLTDLGQLLLNKNNNNNNNDKEEEDDDDDDDDDDTYDYDDEFEEIDDEDIPLDNIEIEQSTENTENTENTETKMKDESIDIPDGLKNMPQEMWTTSFFEAAEIVRKQRTTKRKKIIQTKTKKINETQSVNTKKINEAFITNKQLKRSPLKNEGDHTNITNKDNDENNNNLKFAQFIPKDLVDYDERELIKIKRSMMTEHIPILRMLSNRLRYLRQLKSLWKKKKLNQFAEILKQIQNDNQCGNNTVFISFIQSILKDISTKSFSFRFCHLLLSIIDLKQLDINNESAIIIILTYIHYILETFSSLIAETIKMKIVNEKDLNMVDRRQHCQSGHELLTNNIKEFILKIQEQQQENIKIDELCNKNLTLIELL